MTSPTPDDESHIPMTSPTLDAIRRRLPAWTDLLALAAIFAAVLALQLAGGAYANEFGGHPDEAGHYVTGLMMRDYALSRDWSSPMHFAQNYYVHYPKVALGHWPPVFYLAQATWTIPFGPSRASVMLLMGTLTTALAGTLYHVVARRHGRLSGLVAALVLVGLPVTQDLTGVLMADVPVALLSFWAALAFARYLDGGRWRDSTAFGVLAGLTILTKGNGIFMALVPPLALVLSGRWRLLARPSFYWPAALVCALCGPWFAFASTPKMLDGISQKEVGFAYMLKGLWYYGQLHNTFGYGVACLAIVGLTEHRRRFGGDHAVLGLTAVMAAMVLGVVLVSCAVPVGFEARYFLPTVAPLLVLAADGVKVLARHLLPSRRAWLDFAAFAAIACEMFTVSGSTYRGFSGVARDILTRPDLAGAVALVSSDAEGEGMFIAEVAGSERRPGHVVLRATKALARVSWAGLDYEPIYRTAAEVVEYLERVPVHLVVVDTSISPQAARLGQQPELLQAVEGRHDRWEFVGSYPRVGPEGETTEAIKVFRRLGLPSAPRSPIRVQVEGDFGPFRTIARP